MAKEIDPEAMKHVFQDPFDSPEGGAGAAAAPAAPVAPAAPATPAAEVAADPSAFVAGSLPSPGDDSTPVFLPGGTGGAGGAPKPPGGGGQLTMLKF